MVKMAPTNPMTSCQSVVPIHTLLSHPMAQVLVAHLVAHLHVPVTILRKNVLPVQVNQTLIISFSQVLYLASSASFSRALQAVLDG